jgi:hypothetical protein
VVGETGKPLGWGKTGPEGVLHGNGAIFVVSLRQRLCSENGQRHASPDLLGLGPERVGRLRLDPVGPERML